MQLNCIGYTLLCKGVRNSLFSNHLQRKPKLFYLKTDLKFAPINGLP